MAIPNISTAYQVANAANELTGILHGTSLNQITDLPDVWNRAARRVLQDVDPAETKMDIQFGQVWDGVFDYPLPADVKGNKIVQLYPQQNQSNTYGDYGQVYNKPFQLSQNYSVVPDFTIRYSGGNRTIRINANNLNTGIQINAADAINDNGLWSTGGNVSNIQTDNQYYTAGSSGSVSFQLNQTGTPGSTGYIENSTFGAVNLTTHFNNAYEFFQAYLPNAAGFSNIELRFGSDKNNYYALQYTTDYTGNNWVNGWNQQGASWTGATTVGSPNIASIGYLRVTFTYNGTLQTQVRVDQIWSRLGVIFNINYYSKYLFMDSGSYQFKQFTTSNNDYINLDTDSRNLFLYAAALEAVQQQQGLSAQFFDDPNLEAKYADALSEYQSKYKSEITKPRLYYYKQPATGYRRFFGRGRYWGG